MKDEDITLKVAKLAERLDEAHKVMDKIYGRESLGVKLFGTGIGVLLAFFAGFQFVNSHRLDNYIENAKQQLQAELKEYEKQIKDALGKSVPQRVVIEDYIGAPGVLEFGTQIRGHDGNANLRIVAPYYVLAEGGNGGLVALSYSMSGALAQYIVEKAWQRKGALARMNLKTLREGHFDPYYIKDHYNDQGFAFLPGDQRRRFQLSFVFEVADCAAAEALYEEMRQNDLGTIELSPVTTAVRVAQGSSYVVQIMEHPDHTCTHESAKLRAIDEPS
jgi:hypothetical protein